MSSPPPSPSSEAPHRHLPGRWQALLFHGKTRVLQLRRALSEIASAPPRHSRGIGLADAPVRIEKRAPLWRDMSAAEFPLTAGKVENLRRSASAFHGLEMPANAVFSFWRQLGRTTRHRGFTSGRELREGCLVPAIGGGLCQLSGLLYQAALDAGLQVIERHAHSRILPGSAAEQNLDATVFWNYVDLRFSGSAAWRLEVELTAAELIVRIRMEPCGSAVAGEKTAVRLSAPEVVARPAPSGDCLTCGMISCFRHPSATAAHAPSLGHSAFLLDARWPEFDAWCRDHSREGDRWLLPLDGRRWKKPNYAWTPPPGTAIAYATATTLLRSWRQRRLPAQGAIRQAALLTGEKALARSYAAQLSPECRHLVIAQNLLPHLWLSGALGGRSFDVLMVRSPLDELQQRLDTAQKVHPGSPTLGDFRAPPELVRAEREALTAAGRLITPHRDLANRLGQRAWLIDWEMPRTSDQGKAARNQTTPLSSTPARFFLPCSPLGRKGIHELAAALRGLENIELLVLGAASEGAADPLHGLHWRRATLEEMRTATAVVLPAWVEHQPRLALRALAMGIPVIATTACGLPDHELLHRITSPSSPAFAQTLRALAQPPVPACVA